jgi:uncharacterized protein YlaI
MWCILLILLGLAWTGLIIVIVHASRYDCDCVWLCVECAGVMAEDGRMLTDTEAAAVRPRQIRRIVCPACRHKLAAEVSDDHANNL